MNDNQLKTILKRLQQECNTLYANYGATVEVINLQAAINGFRCKFDVTDESELVFEDFVQ